MIPNIYTYQRSVCPCYEPRNASLRRRSEQEFPNNGTWHVLSAPLRGDTDFIVKCTMGVLWRAAFDDGKWNQSSLRWVDVDHQPALFIRLVMIKAVSKRVSLESSRFVVLLVVLFPGAELQPGGSALHMEDICTRLFAHAETGCLSAFALWCN